MSALRVAALLGAGWWLAAGSAYAIGAEPVEDDDAAEAESREDGGGVVGGGTGAVPPRPDDPCANAGWGLPLGPTRAGLLAGDLGAGHRACGRKEVGIGFGGALTIDRPAFFGHLAAQLVIDGSWTPVERLEVFAELELLRVEMLITPIASKSISIGHTSIGVSYGFLRSKHLALAAHSRVVLPTAAYYRNAVPFSLDVGLAGQLAINRHLALHGDTAFVFQAMAGSGPAAPRAGLGIVVGAEVTPVPEVGIVLDLKSRLGWGGQPLDMLAGAFGLHFSDCKRFGFAIDVTLPLLGRERALAAFELRASVRLGPLARPQWEDHVHPGMMGAKGPAVMQAVPVDGAAADAPAAEPEAEEPPADEPPPQEPLVDEPSAEESAPFEEATPVEEAAPVEEIAPVEEPAPIEEIAPPTP